MCVPDGLKQFNRTFWDDKNVLHQLNTYHWPLWLLGTCSIASMTKKLNIIFKNQLNLLKFLINLNLNFNSHTWLSGYCTGLKALHPVLPRGQEEGLGSVSSPGPEGSRQKKKVWGSVEGLILVSRQELQQDVNDQ